MRKKSILSKTVSLILIVGLITPSFVYSQSDERTYDYNEINAGRSVTYDQYRQNSINQQNFLNQQNQRLRNLYTPTVKVAEPIKQLNIEPIKPDTKPALQKLPVFKEAIKLPETKPEKTGFVQKVKDFVANAVVSISRGVRNFYYMVTGQWGAVKTLRAEITKQNSQKVGALVLLIGTTEIKTLNIKELRNVVTMLSALPENVSYTAENIKAEFETAKQNINNYREKLNKLDIKALKDDIVLYNKFFGQETGGGITLNEDDVVFLRDIANRIHEQMSSFDNESLINKRLFSAEQKEVLNVIKQSIETIETAENTLNAFKETLYSIQLRINPAKPEDVPYEILKDQVSQIDYIACKMMMDELSDITMPFVEGAIKGDFKEEPTWQNNVGQIIGALNPLDFVADGRDICAGCIKMVKTNFQDGKLNTVCAGIGIVPVFGNGLKLWAKSIFKNTDIVVKSSKKVINILSKSEPQRIVKGIAKTDKITSKWITVTAEEVNNKLLKRHIKFGGKAEDFFLSYKPGTKIYEFTLDKPKQFLRAYDGTEAHRYGVWLDKAHTIEVNPNKYFGKTALPSDYKYYQRIEVKDGTRMRVGIANGGNFNGIMREGGAVQFETIVDNYDVLQDHYKFIDDKVGLRGIKY